MPSRREFIQSAAATTAVLTIAPFIRASNKSGLGPVVVGTGEHSYEVEHDWGQLPKDLAWGNTHGIGEDSQGNIHIKHTVHATSMKPDAIAVFDANGKFIRSWGGEYKGGAHGLHLSKEKDGEYLYLCDQARGVVDKTTLAGEKVWTKTCPMESGLYNEAKEYHPTNVAVVPMGVGPRAGEFFIADGYGKSWIHRYNAKSEYLNSFGGPGAERGQVSCPHGLMIDTRTKDANGDPHLVIADRSNHRLQYFTLDGRHVKFVKEELKSPCHFDERGGVLLVPDLQARVTLLDKENKLISHLGDGENYNLRGEAREKFIPGKFIAPHSAIFGRVGANAGSIFVVEWVEVGRVTRLRKA
jgi:hypothetical protein